MNESFQSGKHASRSRCVQAGRGNEGGFFASMRTIDSTLVLPGTGFVAGQFLKNKSDTPLWVPSGGQCRGVAGREWR